MDQVQFLRNITRTPFGEVVGYPYEHHPGCKTAGVIGAHPRRGVSPIRSSGNSDPVFVRDPLCDQMILPVHLVVECRSALIALAAIRKVDPTSRTSSVIGVGNGVSVPRSHLAWAAVTRHPPVGVMRFRTTVDHRDGRCR